MNTNTYRLYGVSTEYYDMYTMPNITGYWDMGETVTLPETASDEEVLNAIQCKNAVYVDRVNGLPAMLEDEGHDIIVSLELVTA